jgi:prepilin-type N-terminal cleavage/methylation domain-containing protein
MSRVFTKPLRNQKGFTLTELIVVVAILGVLAAVATPSIIGYLNDAKVSTDEANATTIESTIMRGIAKGTLTLPFADTDAIEDFVEGELEIPAVKQSDMYFVVTLSTGRVKVAATAGDGEMLLWD